MLKLGKIYKAPPHSGEVILGRTLPSLLDEACDRHPNLQAFNQWTDTGWQSLSSLEFRHIAEELGSGLLDAGLQRGDRIALMMYSDANFCIADMACLLTGLINVPIDLTQNLEHIVFILRHSEAEALIVSNLDLLYQIVPYLWDTPNLKTIVVVDVTSDWQATRSELLACQLHSDGGISHTSSMEIPASACLCIPMLLCQGRIDRSCPQLPQCVQVFSLLEMRARGQSPQLVEQHKHLRSLLEPQAIATIIYIPAATGQPQGVVLTHENLSANALAAFSGMIDLDFGDREIVLSFLPLNHVFARALIYGHINYGHSIYFTTPNRVQKHLKEVKPTILSTVPLLLEKAHSKLLERGKDTRTKNIKERRFRLNLSLLRQPLLPFQSLWQSLRNGFVRKTFNWSLNLAKRYELGKKPQGLYALQLKIADKLVYPHWRAIFGGRLKFLLTGGAALKAEIANQFAAAGIGILQGYGLTESGSVICVNRGEFNQAGTVGVPIAGVEMAIAEDGEILVRAPFVTAGFYKNSTATRQALDDEHWLHTGDLGEFTPAGLLKITGCKKNLFKLSTGKYVTPQPLEEILKQSPLVEQAIAIGSQRKFCAMLIFPNLKNLRDRAQEMGLEMPFEELFQHPAIVALYQNLVDAANQPLPPWSNVKRFKLLHATLAAKSEMLTSSHSINRAQVNAIFAAEIDDLYGETEVDETKRRRVEQHKPRVVQQDSPIFPYEGIPANLTIPT
jgi:long-chain acyl-CoA synthetase